ncbi:MAG: ATP-binding protein [Chloroflexi bacterium]|nr:ATP-binding protein [Chloroflexota bacterium]
MRLPARPESIEELEERLSSGELRESRSMEFKQELPLNKALAKHIAGLAAEGGALVIGVEETPTGNEIRPLDCKGTRERVEQIARDIPVPPVDIESYILDSEGTGHGVLWIEIPVSPAMLHQVDGTYYERGDTQTRPMADSEVADRMRLRQGRYEAVRDNLDAALKREEPGGTEWPGRTCIVARPIGASEDEFFGPTRASEEWKSFAYEVMQPSGMLPVIGNRYWGILKTRNEMARDSLAWSHALFGYRDIEVQETGAFCLLSYCRDWLPDRTEVIQASSAVLACREALFLIEEVQRRTGQRRMWDLAFCVSMVEGFRARKRTEQWQFGNRFVPKIPRDHYRMILTGVSTQQLTERPRSVIEQLAGRFIAECGLDFDEELPASFFP